MIPLSLPLSNPSSADDGEGAPLILFPSGTGIGTLYAQLRPMRGLAMHALNIPTSINTAARLSPSALVSDVWLDEIVRLGRGRPYMLAGYSAGGYTALEAARQLLSRGERVAKLILIDSLPPNVFPTLPLAASVLADKKRLRGPKPLPAQVAARSEAAIEAIEQYRPEPLAREACKDMTVYVIWASSPVVEDPSEAVTHGLDLQNAAVRLLWTSHRASAELTPRGWEHLMPGAKFWVTRTPGHHYDLWQDPNVKVVGEKMHHAVSDGLDGFGHEMLAKEGWRELGAV